jgi:hypothetical protein
MTGENNVDSKATDTTQQNPVQSQTPITSQPQQGQRPQFPSGLDKIRKAESDYKEKVIGAPVSKATEVQSAEPQNQQGTRKVPYTFDGQNAEMELEPGLSVEPGSPGEKQIKRILAGFGHNNEFVDMAKRPATQDDLAQAIREQTETLRQTVRPKQEPSAFNPLDYVTETEKPVVENTIRIFENLGMEREQAEQVVNGIFGAIGSTRAVQTVTTEQSQQQTKENVLIQQMSRLHSIDPEGLPNPFIDPNETAGALMRDGGFFTWLQTELGIQPDMMSPYIVKQYRKYKNEQMATNGNLSKANLNSKAITEPVIMQRPPSQSRDIEGLKTISQALSSEGGSAIGTQLSQQELAEFSNMPPNMKKAKMNLDFRYYNAWAVKNGRSPISSNEELRRIQAGLPPNG